MKSTNSLNTHGLPFLNKIIVISIFFNASNLQFYKSKTITDEISKIKTDE